MGDAVVVPRAMLLHQLLEMLIWLEQSFPLFAPGTFIVHVYCEYLIFVEQSDDRAPPMALDASQRPSGRIKTPETVLVAAARNGEPQRPLWMDTTRRRRERDEGSRRVGLEPLEVCFFIYTNDYLLINVGYACPRVPTCPTALTTRRHHEAAVAAPAPSRDGQGLETGASQALRGRFFFCFSVLFLLYI
jgi:hypothetical protein